MTNIPSNYVRFEILHLSNYGIFSGSQELLFDRHQTLILGRCGTGKTTIVSALAQLGPVQGVKPNNHAKRPEMSVDVVTKGNRDLVKEYSSLIFLSSESRELPMFKQEAPFAGILNHHDLKAIRAQTRETFQNMLHRKPWKTESQNELIPQYMAAGERVCLGYAYAFAVRKVLNLDLPVVLDSPYGRIDLEQRRAVRTFLKEQPYQQILLGNESELSEEDKPRYVLDYTKDYSTAIKTIYDDR